MKSHSPTCLASFSPERCLVLRLRNLPTGVRSLRQVPFAIIERSEEDAGRYFYYLALNRVKEKERRQKNKRTQAPIVSDKIFGLFVLCHLS